MKIEKSLGCRKCGGTVAVEIAPWPTHAEVRVKSSGEIKQKFGKVIVVCTNKNKSHATCHAEVAELHLS